jgi:hypothetical protein
MLRALDTCVHPVSRRHRRCLLASRFATALFIEFVIEFVIEFAEWMERITPGEPSLVLVITSATVAAGPVKSEPVTDTLVVAHRHGEVGVVVEGQE